MAETLTYPPPLAPSPFGNFLMFCDEMDAGEAIWPMIEVCSRHGVCHAEPEFFILARPVDSTEPLDRLNSFADLLENPEDVGLTDRHDAWHILYASGGDLTAFFRIAPYELPNLVWQRDGVGRKKLLNYQTTKRKIHHG